MEKFPPQLKDQSLLAKWHWRLRWASFPFRSVLRFIPKQGVVVDFGCGGGILSYLLAQTADKRQIIAGDIAVEKIKLAKKLLAQFSHVAVRRIKSGWLPLRVKVQAMVILDVLYLLDDAEKLRWLGQLVARLSPQGKLIVAIVPKELSWRYWLAWLQEWVMVRGLQLTRSGKKVINFETEAGMRRMLKQVGLVRVKRYQLPTCWPFVHKHILFIGERKLLRIKDS